MNVDIFLCQDCNLNFAIEIKEGDTNSNPADWCPVCPVCQSADNVYDPSKVGVLNIPAADPQV